MRFLQSLILILLSGVMLLFPACRQQQAEEQVPEETFSFDWDAMANLLAKRMALQPGEKVLLVGKTGEFDELAILLRQIVTAAGAEDLGAISVDTLTPEGWASEFSAGARGKNRNELVQYFQEVDLGIMLPGATPADDAYAALQELLKKGKGRTIHFHWSGAYDLNGRPLEINDRISACYQDVLLRTDYQQLAEKQRAFEAAMRGSLIQVTTPSGTDIRFRIGDRPVTRQDGDASAARAAEGRNLIDREIELPAGAVRVAPLEESVEGTIAFPEGEWNGQPVSGVIMTFQQGKLVNFQAAEGMEAVVAELQKGGEAARAFREFALGMNPLLAIPEEDPWIPYYGYGAGVVRLSLGDNTELGGKVGGGYVRWNFFTDATVKVGDEVWVEKGRLIK